MIAAKFDMLQGLGGLIGGNPAVPTGQSSDFGGMLAAMTSGNETDVAASMPTAAEPIIAPSAPAVISAGAPVVITAGGEEPVMIEAYPQRPTAVPIVGNSRLPMPPASIAMMPKSAETLTGSPPIEDVLTAEGPERAEASRVSVTPESEPVPIANLVEPRLIVPEVVAQSSPPHGPKLCALEHNEPKINPPLNAVGTVIAAPALPDAVKPVRQSTVEITDTVNAVAVEQRVSLTTTVLTPHKAVFAMPDRLPTFAPLIADAVRDLVTMSRDKDLRFNVRPEALGPVAVTIERSDAGFGLRLGVETPAAVQVLRQAEPMLNDVRGNAPFLQLTVDLNLAEQRGRPARTAMIPKRDHDAIVNEIEPPTAMPSGRFA